MDIIDALERFMLQLAANGRSPHTRRQYRRHVLLFARWLAGDCRCTDIGTIGHEDLAQFFASPVAIERAAGGKRKATSANALRTSLRCFFRHLHEAGYTEANPARLLKRAITGSPPPRALTAKEEERLLAVFANAQGVEERRDAMLFTLLLRTGLRLSSALRLNVEEVDLDEGVLSVHTKRDRRERVYITPSVQIELRRFLGDRESGPLFTSQSGRKITARHAQRRFTFWRERGGLPNTVSPHSLRHTFGQRLYNATGDLFLVQHALNHRAISSTAIYARVDGVRLREAISRA